jgi:hypothetical protein
MTNLSVARASLFLLFSLMFSATGLAQPSVVVIDPGHGCMTGEAYRANVSPKRSLHLTRPNASRVFSATILPSKLFSRETTTRLSR